MYRIYVTTFYWYISFYTWNYIISLHWNFNGCKICVFGGGSVCVCVVVFFFFFFFYLYFEREDVGDVRFIIDIIMS